MIKLAIYHVYVPYPASGFGELIVKAKSKSDAVDRVMKKCKKQIKGYDKKTLLAYTYTYND